MNLHEWLKYISSRDDYKLCIVSDLMSVAMLLLSEIEDTRIPAILEKIVEIQTAVTNIFDERFSS